MRYYSVSQCWSLYDCQTHKLLWPNGWLGSIEGEYFLILCSEVFLKNIEPFWGKMTSNTSMLSGSCWWYRIVQVCLLFSMFSATPDAQSAAAKWLTRFIFKVIFFCIRWRKIRHKSPACFCAMCLRLKSYLVVIVRNYSISVFHNVEVYIIVRRTNCCGQTTD